MHEPALHRVMLAVLACPFVAIALACGGLPSIDREGGVRAIYQPAVGCRAADAATVIQARIDARRGLYATATADSDTVHIELIDLGEGHSLHELVSRYSLAVHAVDEARTEALRSGDTTILPDDRTALPNGRDNTVVVLPPAVTRVGIQSAQATVGQFGEPIVQLQLTADAARAFGELSTASVGQHIAIVLDDMVLSEPVVMEPIVGGMVQVTDPSHSAEALAAAWSVPPLPCELTLLSETTVPSNY